MKNKILNLIYILVGIIILYFVRTNFSEYNIKKTVSACIISQQATSESFDPQKAKKFCEEKIRKKKED